jgi:hypothetical protein
MPWKSEATEQEAHDLIRKRVMKEATPEELARLDYLFEHEFVSPPELTEEASENAVADFMRIINELPEDREPSFAEILIAAQEFEGEAQVRFIFSYYGVKLRRGDTLTTEEEEFLLNIHDGNAQEVQKFKQLVVMTDEQALNLQRYGSPKPNVFDVWDSLPRGEKDKAKNFFFGATKLFGYGEQAEKVREAFGGSKSTLTCKADALDKLFREYEQALIDHPEQAKTLKRIYEEEKRKILES